MRFRCQRCFHPLKVPKGASLLGFPCPACGREVVIDRAERTLGSYEILEALGHGGFASVWRARRAEGGPDVAIKVARRDDPEDRELMHVLREARLSKDLDHPGLVRVLDAGQTEEYCYIVSEYVDGPTLNDWRAKHSPSPADSARLCARLADAVNYLHERRIVHRDLTPQNILVNAEGHPRLIDFGLSKRDGDQKSMAAERYRQARYLLNSRPSRSRKLAGPLLGTLAYMSPEQARGEGMSVSAASDVYSLGVLLYEMLTGKRPYEGAAEELLQQIKRGKWKRPRRLNRHISPAIEAVCLKAMALDPGKRYATAREFAQDCSRAADESAEFHGGSAWSRIIRSFSRS